MFAGMQKPLMLMYKLDLKILMNELSMLSGKVRTGSPTVEVLFSLVHWTPVDGKTVCN